MKKYALILMLAPLLFTSFTTFKSEKKVNFIENNVELAKKEAFAEGKLVFVKFEANYCAPCRNMNENTFTNNEVISYLNQNYKSVNVDIQNFDGHNEKVRYNIKLLPSIIIFNSEGKILHRYQESMGPTKLLNELRRYNYPENRKQAPVRKPSNSDKPKPKPKPTITPATTDNKEEVYRFKVVKQPQKGFSIQVGAFAKHESLLNEISRLQKAFDKPILVQLGSYNGNTIYKVMVGEFASRGTATKYLQYMNSKGVPGLIKDLSR